jgi:hypothetical protein
MPELVSVIIPRTSRGGVLLAVKNGKGVQLRRETTHTSQGKDPQEDQKDKPVGT